MNNSPLTFLGNEGFLLFIGASVIGLLFLITIQLFKQYRKGE